MDSSGLSNPSGTSHTPSSATLSPSSSPPTCKMGAPAVALLPPELLCNMFEAYRDAEPHSRPVRCRDRVPEWIAVLHVCRAWRLTASSYASLWTRLDFSSAEWTNVFLNRSRNLPLHVDADFSSVAGADSVRAARAAMTHMHRIRELSIKADDRLDIHEIMRTYTRFPAPSLQTLVFSCPAYSMSFVPYFFQELFCGQTPALRVLRVKNASFEPDMTSHLVRNLTHFEMTGAMSWRWFSKMRDFHSMLGASPHLQSLMLEYSIPSERSAPPDVTPSTPPTPEDAYTIELPSLRTIKIQDYSRSLRQFLEHLAIPPSTSIHLSMNTDDTETDESAQGGITSLVSGIHIDPISTIHSLHFDVRQSKLHIRGWKQHEVPKNRTHWPHETLRLVMDGYSRYLINGTLMQSITGALPLSEVQYMRADLHEPLERPVWQHLLWTMRGIEDAVVTGTITTHEFIECLGLAPDAGDGSPDEQRDACCIGYNLPLLERVTLLRIDVDDEWYDCLVEGLLSRRRLGAPKLKWLHIEPSKARGLDGSYFEQLEDAVSVVTLSTLEQSAWS